MLWKALGAQMTTWDIVWTEILQIPTRSRSKEEAEEVGYIGEKFVFGYMKYLYKNERIEVKWCNEAKESGLPFDLTVWDARKEKFLYIEVKSSSVSVQRDQDVQRPNQPSTLETVHGGCFEIYVQVIFSGTQVKLLIWYIRTDLRFQSHDVLAFQEAAEGGCCVSCCLDG
ncbi:DUF3883 domain protein [Medicago truncatula]|uniref:DUF3883 domain protein n=1 Tax=Medicago truncatula TaxID=3880 RepID=G7JKZ7_MEDTR|nr:DUF3883 domain protein [Medicago truncatula]